MADNEKISKATVKAGRPTSAPNEKPKLGESVSKQQKYQIILLAVILVIVAVCVYLFTIRPNGQVAEEEVQSPIETEFNTDILEEVRARSSGQIDINTEGLGKSNPFSGN